MAEQANFSPTFPFPDFLCSCSPWKQERERKNNWKLLSFLPLRLPASKLHLFPASSEVFGKKRVLYFISGAEKLTNKEPNLRDRATYPSTHL